MSVCAMCFGVFTTWVGILVLLRFGFVIDLWIPAIFMGGSVVGIADKLESRLPQQKVKWHLLWKTLFVVSGFSVVYALLENLWAIVSVVAGAMVFMTLLYFFVFYPPKPDDAKQAHELAQKMKNCC